MPSTFHILDTSTGLFYDKYEFHGHKAQPACSPSYSPKGLGKAFKDLAKVKIHLLYLIGNMDPPRFINDLQKKMWERIRLMGRNWDTDPEYQCLRDEIDCWHELHPGYRNVPEFMTNPYPLESIPNTWEVVEVTDKKARQWTLVDFNPATYAEEAKKLRRLTDTYGSAVRDVYKKLEKSGKMAEMPYMAAVMLDINTLDKKVHNWWEGASVDPVPVDDAIKQMGTKRSDMTRSTKKESIAVAFRTQEEAFMFRMCYSGIDRVGVLDLKHLVEIVEDDNQEKAQ